MCRWMCHSFPSGLKGVFTRCESRRTAEIPTGAINAIPCVSKLQRKFRLRFCFCYQGAYCNRSAVSFSPVFRVETKKMSSLFHFYFSVTIVTKYHVSTFLIFQFSSLGVTQKINCCLSNTNTNILINEYK